MQCVDDGKGDVGVVFVHGFACTIEDWDDQARHFRERYRVLRCNLGGHGSSPGTLENANLVLYGDEVAGIIQAAGLQRAVLVGHSMGCRVVLQAALRLGDRVHGLVLIDGSYRAAADPSAVIRRAIEREGDFHSYIHAQFSSMFVNETARSKDIIGRALAFPPDAGESLIAQILAWDAEQLEPALRHVRSLALLLIQSTIVSSDGRRASLQPEDADPWIEFVLLHAPQAEVERVFGAGHFVMIEQAESVNQSLDRFVAKVLKPLEAGE